MGLNIKKILQTAVGGGGGVPSTQKKTPVSAPAYIHIPTHLQVYLPRYLPSSGSRGGGFRGFKPPPFRGFFFFWLVSISKLPRTWTLTPPPPLRRILANNPPPPFKEFLDPPLLPTYTYSLTVTHTCISTYPLADPGGPQGARAPPFEIPKRVFKRDPPKTFAPAALAVAAAPPFPLILDPPLPTYTPTDL